MLNKEGLDQLSIRRLADLLGIRTASLYWHIKDKAELIQLLADSICGLIPLPDSGSWRMQAFHLKKLFRRHLFSTSTFPSYLMKWGLSTLHMLKEKVLKKCFLMLDR